MSTMNHLRRWVLTAMLVSGLIPAQAQELEPAMDIPVAPAEEAVVARAETLATPSRLAPISSTVKSTVNRAVAAANPRRIAGQVRTNYREGRFYATDYSVHSSPRAAAAASIKPLNMGANIRASLRNATSPINLVGSLIGPVTIELNRELATGGHISPSKLAHAFEPGAIAGGLAAGFAGDALGAAAQSALAGTMGPFGPVAGFVARPILSYSCYLLGSNFGTSVAHGKPSLKGALAQSMRQVDPARDTGALVGGSIGGVIGQVLIPIPVLGGVAGGIVGGLVGTQIANFIGHHGITGRIDQGAVAWLHRKADDLDGSGKPAVHGSDSAPQSDAASREAAAKKNSEALQDRFDSQLVMSHPVVAPAQQTFAPRAESTPDDAIGGDLVMAR
ncbi:MAG: hypothetical protein HY303_04860 [Candidatus Wallbacteria bacterium]|nr:hypothetical protein [Candidatus Wallbacteria bacterium]